MIALALQLAAAFNLVCAGTQRTGPIGLAMPESVGTPIEETFRIDLSARLWCRGDCTRVEPLSELTETYAMLRESHEESGGHFIMVELPSGMFSDTEIVETDAILRSGRCRRAAFGGFPVMTV